MDDIKKFEGFLDKMQGLLDEAKKQGHIIVRVEDLEKAFPELKESEDERIRKALIHLVNSNKELSFGIDNYDGIKWSDMLAWLEKQDYTFEIKEGHWYKCVCDYMLNDSDLMFKNDRLYYCRRDWRLTGEIDERNVKSIGVNGYKSFFRPATNQEIKDWLEKQGEQKPNPCDGCINCKGCINCENGELRETEQKSLDKVEPKFHEGDWIICDNYIDRIERTTDRFYHFASSDCGLIEDIDEYYRRWSIKDANPGDVLFSSSCKLLMVYKNEHECYVGYNLNYNSDSIVINKPVCIPTDVQPATKEQRDTLFVKMKEAGYEWDSDKKELIFIM